MKTSLALLVAAASVFVFTPAADAQCGCQPTVSYYAPVPTTAYYSAPVTVNYAPTTAYYAPTTAYYAPTTAYYAPTTAYYAPTTAYYPTSAVYAPTTAYYGGGSYYRGGLFGTGLGGWGGLRGIDRRFDRRYDRRNPVSAY